MKYISSPIFYMGNKKKLLKDIIPLLPENINTFYDLFGGSATVSINVVDICKNVVYNDFNTNVVELVKMFQREKPEDLNKYFEELKDKYKFRTFSVKNIDGKRNCKDMEDEYLKFRKYYNSNKNKDYRDLYLLSCYSMNHLMRFNSNDEFNVSVGADSYSPKIYELIINAHNKLKDIEVLNKDVFDIDFNSIEEGDFVYLDPPYLNTDAVYNEKRAYGGWTVEDDYKLFDIIDELNERNVKFGLSNVFENRGIVNKHLIDWANKNNYYIHHFDRQYNPFSTTISFSDEVYITNVKNTTYKKVGLF